METCDNILFKGDDIAVSIGLQDSDGNPVDPSSIDFRLVFFTNRADKLTVSHIEGVFSSDRSKVVSKCDIVSDKVVVYINRLPFQEGELKIYAISRTENENFDDNYQDLSGCTELTGYTVREK